MESGQARREIVRICKKLDARGLLSATHGNVSIRLSNNNIILTPAGIAKADMDAYDLVIMDLAGNIVEGTNRPNSDIPMHLAIYNKLPDVMSVIRAYPPNATAFACVGKKFEYISLPVELKKMAYVDVQDYQTTPMEERALKVSEAAMQYDVLWTGKNGALTFGKSADDAYFKMESMDLFAQMELAARALRGCGCKQDTPQQDDGLYNAVRDAVMQELTKYPIK